MNIKIAVGAMADRLDAQLSDYGFEVDKCHHYQVCLDNVTRLVLNGYIPPSVALKARDKIVKDVFKNMKKIGA